MSDFQAQDEPLARAVAFRDRAIDRGERVVVALELEVDVREAVRRVVVVGEGLLLRLEELRGVLAAAEELERLHARAVERRRDLRLGARGDRLLDHVEPRARGS